MSRTLIIKIVHEGNEFRSHGIFNLVANTLYDKHGMADVKIEKERPTTAAERREYGIE